MSKPLADAIVVMALALALVWAAPCSVWGAPPPAPPVEASPAASILSPPVNQIGAKLIEALTAYDGTPLVAIVVVGGIAAIAYFDNRTPRRRDASKKTRRRQ
jgi:hypothetical protein